MFKFFTKYDWAAFWVATGVTFGVYFYTLGPSVGLEDSGELATAAAHLGVPHPPGYPFWTLCCWIFCKVFSFVTYMGHPTPAWAVSCCSAVFGAFAAGCTAMLISRSARDFITVSERQAVTAGQDRATTGLSEASASWLCLAGGVGGALAFAFSPVEWSQSTIVEIYSLNALFLMLVFLLTYRWMNKPSDAVLWITAFIFGLGLTNYQVLLFAIVPLAIVIALRNVPLFRDFALYLVPALLTFQVLDVGSLDRAQVGMERDAIAKHAPAGMSDEDYSVMLNRYFYEQAINSPSQFKDYQDRVQAKLNENRRQTGLESAAGIKAMRQHQIALEAHKRMLDEVDRQVRRKDVDFKHVLQDTAKREIKGTTQHGTWMPGLVLSLAVLVGACLTALFFSRKRNDPRSAFLSAAVGGGVGLVLMAVSCFCIPCELSWTVTNGDLAQAPLLDPLAYATVAILIAGSVTAAVAGYVGETRVKKPCLAVCSGLALLSVLVAWGVSTPSMDLASAFGYGGEPYVWSKSTFLFLSVVIALFALSAFVKGGLFYAIPVAGFHLAVFILLCNGAMNGLTHPATWWFWWPVVWNFVVLALAWLMLPHGRSVAGAAFFTQLGVAFYAYMPIVSDWRNPPMNWGYPRTWEGFKHAITRGQYEQIKAEEFASIREFWEFMKVQMGHYASDVKMQFTDFLAFLALAPFACWRFCVKTKTGRRPWTVRLLWVAAGFLVLLLLQECFGLTGEEETSFWARLEGILLYALGGLAFAGCLIVGVKQFLFRPAVALRHFLDRCRERNDRLPMVALGVLAAELLIVPLVLSVKFGTGGKVAVLLSSWLVIVTALVFTLRKLLVLLRQSRAHFNLTFDARNVSQQWLISSGACFLMMSVLLIVLAKVVGDVQDGFIQKVKFISSHAMIAMWIGYGLIFVAAMIVRFVPVRYRKFVVVPLALLLVLIAGLPPICQNYVGDIHAPDNVVFQLGGAEQNNHTFGWQFGAYQLNGAKAIREQLTEDEEPLPDPEWPAPMEDHAVFFGGTDPGRFVPTYMIYSADYRPDVYLITQNALADGTYMNVERDLYGDEIWIPSNSDNSTAFEEFVSRLTPEEELLYGVDKSNGRVQVTGANSVMKINEILARRMFENNRDRHAFYVEESYPMPWMYDFLTPHGLILKVEHDETSGRKGGTRLDWVPILRKDRDFWDWYVRRLIDDTMYRRDFAAQKSFAKLRSAIAGLYLQQRFMSTSSATQQLFEEACDQSFREACLLAPISPESTFRYLQLHRMNRPTTQEAWCRLEPASLNVIEDLLDYLDRMDPHNQRTASQRATVALWRGLYAAEAAALKADGNTQVETAYRLALAYAAVAAADQREGNRSVANLFNDRAGELLVRILPRLSKPAEILSATLVLSRSRRYAEPVLEGCRRYGALTGSVSMELELAMVKAYYWLGQKDRSLSIFRSLVQRKPKDLESACRRDPDLQQVINAFNETLNKKY